MLNRLLTLCPLLLMVQSALAEEPQWLKDARAKEGNITQAMPFKSQDGFFSAKVLGKVLDDVTADDGAYAIELDIGAATPANCELIVDGFDLAAILRATAELTFKEVEPIQGKVGLRSVERTDAGVFGSSPYLTLSWVYRVNDGKADRLGGLKQFAALKNGHGLYCSHVDLGYSKSFHDAVRTLAESMEFATPGATPYFVEISTATLAGARIGLSIVTMERDAEDDRKLLSSTSLLIPMPDTLRTQDTTHVQWVRPDGSLINASHVVSNNGELDADLGLTLDEDHKWRVKGEFKGKAIDAAIAAGREPATWIEVSYERRKLFARENAVGVQLDTTQWTIADPTRFIDSQTTVLSVIDAARISARENLGGLVAEHVLDKATGMPVKTVIQAGAQSIELERVYIQGTF